MAKIHIRKSKHSVNSLKTSTVLHIMLDLLITGRQPLHPNNTHLDFQVQSLKGQLIKSFLHSSTVLPISFKCQTSMHAAFSHLLFSSIRKNKVSMNVADKEPRSSLSF